MAATILKEVDLWIPSGLLEMKAEPHHLTSLLAPPEDTAQVLELSRFFKVSATAIEEATPVELRIG